MGRINLAALRIRKRALLSIAAEPKRIHPVSLDILADVPPAQILLRQQPIQHQITQLRTRTLSNPDGTPSTRTEQYLATPTTRPPRRIKPGKKASRLFAPIEIEYEEDTLRKQFFADHPWELARPRIVVETHGDAQARADWSTGLLQPGIPLSGESVVQRQLWLLNNVPDMTVESAYDVARREFYTLRRQEQTRKRVAREEALHNGAQMGLSALQWGMKVENKQFDNWQAWSSQMVLEQQQRTAAASGDFAPQGEQKMLQSTMPGQQAQPTGTMGVFAAESARNQAMASRSGQRMARR